MPRNNETLTNKPSLYSVLNTLKDCINYNLDCVKVATVLEFNPALMTVKCRVNSKRMVKLKQDGNQVLKSYPDIYAKCHFFGWGNIGSVYPIEPGMEGLLLFNDREIETWFTTSDGGNLAYDRCHDLTDALFICGLHSQPKIPLLPFIEECLHIYYKGSDFQIKDESVTENTKEHTLNAEDSIEENTKEKTVNAETSIEENTTDYTINTNTSYTLNSNATISENAPTISINGSATTNIVGVTNVNVDGATITLTGKKIYLVCDDFIINGKSYFKHKHTGNLGEPTSGVI